MDVWRNTKFLALPEPMMPEGTWCEEVGANLKSSTSSGKRRHSWVLMKGWKSMACVFCVP
jgi:hypothetical protein